MGIETRAVVETTSPIEFDVAMIVCRDELCRLPKYMTMPDGHQMVEFASMDAIDGPSILSFEEWAKTRSKAVANAIADLLATVVRPK